MEEIQEQPMAEEKKEKTEDFIDLLSKRINQGHTIKRIRFEKGLTQEELGELVHLDQSAISKYERKRLIENYMLEKFAKALEVPLEVLKNSEEEVPNIVIENNNINTDNTSTNSSSSNSVNITTGEESSSTNTDNHTDNRIYNALDKFAEIAERNAELIQKTAELYERLLEEKERALREIQEKLNKQTANAADSSEEAKGKTNVC